MRSDGGGLTHLEACCQLGEAHGEGAQASLRQQGKAACHTRDILEPVPQLALRRKALQFANVIEIAFKK